MKLAENWEELSNVETSQHLNLGLDAALKQLATDRRKEKQSDFPDHTPDFPPGKQFTKASCQAYPNG
jgi:hypothetical protein